MCPFAGNYGQLWARTLVNNAKKTCMHATQKNQLGSVVGSGKYNQVGSAKKIDSVLLKLSSHGSVKQLSLL